MRKARTTQKVPFLAPDVQTKVIPSPTDGWDAISPLAEMDPKRAPILDNWVPRTGFVELRGGFIPYSNLVDAASTAVTDPVETLLVYRSPSGEQMFAAGGTIIVDVTNGQTPTSVVSGLALARWQYINFTPSGGTTVIQLVNGTDTLRQYNGTVWSVPTITGFSGGRTTANIININAHKRRLWYVMENSSVAAFMPTDAISGAIAGEQDFGALWSKGGYLVATASWTIDGGSGPQDYAAFISSRGQITLYTGTDPTSSATWQLVGTFDISPPIGRRCFLRVGSDVAIITQDGVLPISQALPFDPSADRSVAITARIQNAMAMASLQSKNLFGWQIISFPDQQLAVLNVPLIENESQQQYVMNALTGAWCRFIGWNANCFEVFNDDLYWGGNDGSINLAYAGSSDGAETIVADMQCAFNWFEEPGRTKRMTMIQPLLTTSGVITPTIAVDADFGTSTAVAPVTTLVGGVLWDVAVWDVSLWSGISVNYKSWLTVNVLGKALAVRMRVNVAGSDTGIAGVFDIAEFDTAVFDGQFSTTLPILQVNAFNSILESGGAI